MLTDDGPAGAEDKALILLTNFEAITVPVHGTVGPFIIHRYIHNGRETRTGWTVSHVPTGRKVWAVAHFGEAVRVANWLAEHSGMPADKEACLRWRDVLEADRVRFTRFVADLTAVAPRYLPEEAL